MKKTFVITGCSTGIGRALALKLASDGHKVWAGIRKQEDYQKLVLEAGNSAVHLNPFLVDVAHVHTIASAVEKIEGSVDVLVNNAGIAVGGPVEALTMEDWRRQFDLNVFGLIELTRCLLPRIRESHGRILQMSSISGRFAPPFMSAYSASKFAIEAFTDSLRREMIPHGVEVIAIEPGPIRTEIWQKSIRETESRLTSIPEHLKQVYGEQMTELQRLIQKAVARAAEPSLVVEKVLHASFAEEPRTRYPVGPGISLFAFVCRILPDRWLDRLGRFR